jgi:hypothetical protein
MQTPILNLGFGISKKKSRIWVSWFHHGEPNHQSQALFACFGELVFLGDWALV